MRGERRGGERISRDKESYQQLAVAQRSLCPLIALLSAASLCLLSKIYYKINLHLKRMKKNKY